MSRSYKKNAVNKGKSRKEFKKLANKAVRHKLNKIEDDEVGNNANYKKLVDRWDYDYVVFSYTFEEYWTREKHVYEWLTLNGLDEEKPNKDKCYKRWYTRYKGK